jgi:hypothetical protein
MCHSSFKGMLLVYVLAQTVKYAIVTVAYRGGGPGVHGPPLADGKLFLTA